MTKNQTTIFVGIDASKDNLSVAIAGGSGREEVESLGTFASTPASVETACKLTPIEG